MVMFVRNTGLGSFPKVITIKLEGKATLKLSHQEDYYLK